MGSRTRDCRDEFDVSARGFGFSVEVGADERRNQKALCSFKLGERKVRVNGQNRLCPEELVNNNYPGGLSLPH